MQINYYARPESSASRRARFGRRACRRAASARSRSFLPFFRSIRPLIKYSLGRGTAPGNIPESAATAVPDNAGDARARARALARELARPRDIVRSEIPSSSSGTKLRGPQDENVFESRKASFRSGPTRVSAASRPSRFAPSGSSATGLQARKMRLG